MAKSKSSKSKESVTAKEAAAKAPKDEKKQQEETFISRANPAEFAKLVASELVKNFSTLGKLRPFSKEIPSEELAALLENEDEQPLIVVDTSVLVDGRILPIVNSGFVTGTLLIPQFVLGEVQHIADSSDALRRAKGRRGLEVINKLKAQKTNKLLKTKIVKEEVLEAKEVDHKLSALAKTCDARLLTVDFNLAQYARAQGVKVLNVNDLTQALKLSVVPGEELSLKITHEGKEKDQGVGYLTDGTMVVVDNARDHVGSDVMVVISKVHQTPAGQLFFARMK